MASKLPIVRQTAWLSILIYFGFIAVFTAVLGLLTKSFGGGLCLASLLYLTARLLLGSLVPRNHRRGIALSRSGDYSLAIREYEKSYAFFTRHSWIDRYRYIVLLSASRISYKEMALVNIAFCYSQTGDGNMAKKYYEKALGQFPDSGMARTALQMIHAVEKSGAAGHDKSIDNRTNV